MVEPSEGAELLLSLVRADACAFRSCSAPPRRSGSATWANKADIGLVVHRDPNRDPTRTDIFVRKVQFKHVGKIGTTSLRYDRATGAISRFPRLDRWAIQRPMPTTSGTMTIWPEMSSPMG